MWFFIFLSIIPINIVYLTLNRQIFFKLKDYNSPQKNEQKKNKSSFYNCYGKRLRGENPDLISREYGITLADINLWRDQFYREWTDDSKLSAAERKIGQLQLELDLAKKKNELAAKLRRK